MEKEPAVIPIHITIPKYTEKVEGKIVVYYQNIVQMGKQLWEIEKRFSQYDDLHLMLSK